MESINSPTYLSEFQSVTYRILIVEDDKEAREAMKHALGSHGYALKVASRSDEALTIARRWAPQVAVLDVELPDLNGIALSQRLKDCASNPIVIFITSHANNGMRRTCLKTGDEYITKPFDGEDLALRVETRLRRHIEDIKNAQDPGKSIPTINPAGGRVMLPNGRAPNLTPTETRLFNALLKRAGGKVARATLMSEVWGEGVVDAENALDTNIRRLRKKIEREPGRPQIILTVRRCGYRLDMDELRRPR